MFFEFAKDSTTDEKFYTEDGQLIKNIDFEYLVGMTLFDALKTIKFPYSVQIHTITTCKTIVSYMIDDYYDPARINLNLEIINSEFDKDPKNLRIVKYLGLG